jgi:hypothetical protein
MLFPPLRDEDSVRRSLEVLWDPVLAVLFLCGGGSSLAEGGETCCADVSRRGGGSGSLYGGGEIGCGGLGEGVEDTLVEVGVAGDGGLQLCGPAYLRGGELVV